MAERIYLDWNATTPLRPEAQAARRMRLAIARFIADRFEQSGG